jgi:hypothetical protein
MTSGGSRWRANNGSERMSAIWELPERPKSIHKAHKFMLKYEGSSTGGPRRDHRAQRAWLYPYRVKSLTRGAATAQGASRILPQVWQ